MTADQRKVLIFAALGLLVLVLIGGFFVLYERVEKTERLAPSGEARQNPYLATMRLYEGLGYQTWHSRRLPEIDYDDAVVFWMAADRNINPEDIGLWRTWVDAGGHFILIQPREPLDPLLEALDFIHVGAPTNDHARAMLDEAEEGLEGTRRKAGPYDLPSFFGQRIEWDAEDVDWKALDNEGRIIARSRPLGTGRVTLLSTSLAFTNENVRNGDHARFAAQLATLGPVEPDDYVTLVLFGQRVSWIKYVASIFWPFLLSLAVMLLLAMRLGFRRFGPVEAIATPGRRSRTEHIEAMGRFLWNRDAAEVLLKATRQALIARIATRRPSLNALEGAERYALVAEELDISEGEARRLLEAPAPHTPNTFAKTITTLETHRRSL